MAHDKISSSLTAQLYSADDRAIRDATQHAFLEHAGKGTLPASTLCTWLVQDKYYQLAYVNFIGGLLAKLPLASCAFPHSDGDNLTWKTLDMLISALTNIRREIEFYDETAGKYNLQADEAPPNGTTSQYIKLFEDASAKDAPMIHGLVVLWATEQCYLDAWTYASSQTKNADHFLPSVNKEDGAVAALHKDLIPNWTSEEFGDFVKNLASLADAWATKSNPEDVHLSKNFWTRVLALEARFWPDV